MAFLRIKMSFFSQTIIILSSIFKTLKGIKVFVVYLALELLWDAVGELVVVFDPLSSLSVLDGHGRYACSGQACVLVFSKEGNC